jgi:hypothetical protein
VVVDEGRAITAATFRDGIDLLHCDELPAGRSDYRFGQADDGGRVVVARPASWRGPVRTGRLTSRRDRPLFDGIQRPARSSTR